MLSTSESLHGADPVVHYTGLSTQAVATGLKPFTQYTAVLDVSIEMRNIFTSNIDSEAK